MTNRGANGDQDPATTANVAGVCITHPDKVWWPESGITKLDVARYYEEVAPYMLPWLTNRLLTAERCPDGVNGECFFQKDFPEPPNGLTTHEIRTESAGKIVHYLIGGSKTTLPALVNLGCIDVHVMNCRVDSLDRPDWLAFDFDPSSGEFSDAAKAAGVLRRVLEEFHITSFPKTSGGRGVHVLVPLRHRSDQEQVRTFAHCISREVARRAPRLVTVQMSKSKRRGRVFADWLRNAFGQTIVSPYSVRCRAGSPVSTPLDWDEVDPHLNPSSFNIRTIQRRIGGKDCWAEFWSRRQTLPELDLPNCRSNKDGLGF